MTETTLRAGGAAVASSDLVSRDQTLTGDGSTFAPLGVAFPAGGQAFLLEEIVIYARTTGSDTIGDGSLGAPFRTFARAIVDVPAIIPPGRRYVVDVTGIGTETLPADYQMPVIQSPAVRFAYAPTEEFPYYFAANGLTVRAGAQLFPGLSAADATISAADNATVATDAATGLISVTIDANRASWASTDLSGAFLIRSKLGFPLATCCISASDDASLFLCQNANQLNGGNGVLVLAAGEVLQIVQPSAFLQAPAPATSRLGNGAISCSNVSSVNFQGIGFRCTDLGQFGLNVSNTPNPFFELCTVEGLSSLMISEQIALHSTNLSGIVDCEDSAFTIFNSLMHDVTDLFVDGKEAVFFNTVVEDCVTLTTSSFVGAKPSFAWGFLNCRISRSVGPAVRCLGGRYEFSTVQIDDATGDAIRAEQGSNYLLLTNVTGTLNGGFGVLAQDGAQVQVRDTATDVTGTSGDMKSGSQVARTWANFYGTNPIGNEYDLVTPFVADSHGTLKPRGQESGAPCTGTRIFQRTP